MNLILLVTWRFSSSSSSYIPFCTWILYLSDNSVLLVKSKHVQISYLKKSEKLCRKYQIRTTGSVFFFFFPSFLCVILNWFGLPFLYIYVIELYYTLLRWWDKNVTKQQKSRIKKKKRTWIMRRSTFDFFFSQWNMQKTFYFSQNS